MSDELDTAVKAIEGRLENAVKGYESQVAENGKATTAIKADVSALAEDYKQARGELDDRLTGIEQKMADGFGSTAEALDTMGKSFVESDVFEQFKSGSADRARVETKNTIETDQDIIVTQHSSRVFGPNTPFEILDVIPNGQTNGNQVEYVQEGLTSANNATTTKDGAAKTESSLDFSTINAPLRWIPTFIKVSQGVMDDAPALVAYIDNRLRRMVTQELASQIISGDGTGSNLSGFAKTGFTDTFTATSGNAMAESVNEMKYACVDNGYQPDFVVLNPADWGAFERSDMSGYAPGLSYLHQGLTPALWGLPVVISPNQAANTALVGSSLGSMLFRKGGIAVEAFKQDGTNVQSNLITIRAETRAAMTVQTVGAFVSCADITPA